MRLIDADARIDDLMERYCKDCDKRKGIKNGKRQFIYEIGEAPCRACEVDDVKAELEEAPTIDPVKHGTWKLLPSEVVSDDGLWGETRYVCSNCGKLRHFPYPYCPICGAKMKMESYESCGT